MVLLLVCSFTYIKIKRYWNHFEAELRFSQSDLPVHLTGHLFVLCRQHPRQYKYLCHCLGFKWVEYLTSCQVEFELGFSFSLAIAKITDGPSQDIQVQDLGWKSTPVCSVLHFFVLRSFTAGQWKKIEDIYWLVHILKSDPSCRKFPKNKTVLNLFWLSS